MGTSLARQQSIAKQSFDITLLKHQNASLNTICSYPDVPYIFLIGGFGCGKSFTDVTLCLFLYQCYKDSPTPIQIGIFGVTIKLLKQTVLADLERFFDRAGIAYRDNSQAGTLTVGSITFVYLAMQYPDDIYAFNFNCCLCDEIDELPVEKVEAVVKAVQERNRVTMPANQYFDSRPPFVFFSTTAQGMGGTYNLVKSLEKKKINYAIIRGRTQDNPSLDKQQLKLLRKLYTKEEADAFLDGKFVNLTQGRVYYAFMRSKCICMRFPVKETDTVYVGQDFNYGFNACAEIIVRAGIMYIVNSHHWNDMGQGAKELRRMYPENRIVCIPDASGKEIMQGFAEEYARENIEILWNGQNPSIVERIMAINKALMLGQLKVMEPIESERATGIELKNSLSDRLILGLETRDFDDAGKPRKGKGPNALDHGCDATEYATWHIIHTVNGYDDILTALKGVYHRIYESA